MDEQERRLRNLAALDVALQHADGINDTPYPFIWPEWSRVRLQSDMVEERTSVEYRAKKGGLNEYMADFRKRYPETQKAVASPKPKEEINFHDTTYYDAWRDRMEKDGTLPSNAPTNAVIKAREKARRDFEET